MEQIWCIAAIVIAKANGSKPISKIPIVISWIPDVLEQAVIICSDLIEHLRDPTSLVSLLKEWLRFARLGIISTPERDVRWGVKHNGPPPNLHHIREWNAEELDSYLKESGLTVNFLGLTRSINTAYSMWTMFALLGATQEPRTSADYRKARRVIPHKVVEEL